MILGAWIRKVSVGKKAVLIHAAAANPSYPGFQKISDHEIQHASQDSAKLIKCSEGYGGLPQVNGLVLSDATSDCQPRPCAVTIPPGMTAKR